LSGKSVANIFNPQSKTNRFLVTTCILQL
jgi:hypothetical protein